MENRTHAEVSFIESLIEKSEQYTQTSVELLALQALHKGSDMAGAMLSRLMLVLCLMSFLLLFNLAVAFWLGHLWGKWHYGFFAVAGFYATVAAILYFSHINIQNRIQNLIIGQIRTKK
jgi:hypothetical protein